MKRILCTLMVVGLLAGSAWAEILIQEGFAGSGSDSLSGKVPDMLDAGLGSVAWQAGSIYKQDGSFAGDGAAIVDLTATGTDGYINDRKGTASGLFTLAVSYNAPTEPAASDFITLGFFNTNAPDLGTHFASGDTGLATCLWRVSGEIVFYEGEGNNGNEVNSSLTGDQTFIIDLDLTDWNGADNFGSSELSYMDGPTKTSIGSVEFQSDYSFDAVGLSVNDVTDGQVNSLELTMVPEPMTLGILAIGGLVALRRRRSA